MVISSRTPEGEPNRCPVCGQDVRVEPSGGPRDAPCPCCGQLLWFTPGPPASLSHSWRAALDDLVRRGRARLGEPDRGTALVLEAIRAGRWVRALEQHLPEAHSWDELFSRVWEEERS